MNGGMKGLTGTGLGIRGEIIDTRLDSLIRLVDEFGNSSRVFSSRFLTGFGGPDR